MISSSFFFYLIYSLLFIQTGCRMEEHGPILKDLFHTDYFKINVVSDADTVELCGSLKVCSNQDTSSNKQI